MKQNDLEKFIEDQREDFDNAYPSLKLWAGIEKELNNDANVTVMPMKTRRPWYQIAAAALILVTLGGVGGLYLGNTNSESSVIAMIEEIAPEFFEMEQYYNQRIEQQYARLTSQTDDPEIKADLASVDQAMVELREELLDAPSGREGQIVQALIESYRLKLQILERVLEQIEQSNTTIPNNNTNETSI